MAKLPNSLVLHAACNYQPVKIIMKKTIQILLLCFISTVVYSQTNNTNKYADSLKLIVSQTTNDTLKMTTLSDLSDYYRESNADSSLFFAEPSIAIAKKIKQPLWVANLLLGKAYNLAHQGNLSLAFELANEAMIKVQDETNEKNLYIVKDSVFAATPHEYRLSIYGNVFHQMGNIYSRAGNNEKAIAYFKEEIQIWDLIKNKSGLVNSNMNIGSIYLDMNKLDSALLYSIKAVENASITGYKAYLSNILNNIGTIYFKRKQLDSAVKYYHEALRLSKDQRNVASEAAVNISLAEIYESRQQPDSMMYYAKAAWYTATNLKSKGRIVASSQLISNAYKMQGNTDSAFAYLAISKKLGDSLNTDKTEKLTQFQNINFDEQLRLEKVEKENIAYKNNIRTTILFAGLGLLAILAFVFYRNNRQKHKANIILQNQKQEIENTLVQLKAAQSQLIQSEKMASLGELTAGIAHEIQNPLNFVNNFSEVNKELLVEMKDEMQKGNYDEAKEIIEDVIGNEEKINHHGKRADAIVKGMLQHSRNSSNAAKEPTDINKLADEYLRLAYHGLRAKDKTFNATLKTDFDETIGNINIIPQDIGRVILNLITNAFYVVDEKKKSGIGDGYQPTVLVSTKKSGDKILIIVKDNGNGIPQKIVAKIFQPFFTTKPTGQGTGLGLSMSYDIVKAHGGEIKVETNEGSGTEFIITLPI